MKKEKTIPTYRIVKEESNIIKKTIRSSRDMYDYIRLYYDSSIDVYETMFLTLLNNSNTTIGWVRISQGGITGTVADLRLICKYAIENLATQVLLCHNHPSGNTFPSLADKSLTRDLKKALEIFQIGLLDHIIVTADDKYYSFADEGEL